MHFDLCMTKFWKSIRSCWSKSIYWWHYRLF